jgi:prepilin-type N-terminal cleavage/methylation domain-containing protein
MKLSAQSFKQLRKGFTLIELLVVIAVIGVLATIVLLAVNPAEQLARGRDTARISAITQVGRALQGYYTVQNPAAYPTVGTTWMTTLVTSGDLKTTPTNPTYSGTVTSCNAAGTQAQNGYCYNTGANETIVFARLESSLYTGKCSGTTVPFWVFSASNAKACGVCTANATTDPAVAAAVTCSF